MHAVVILLLVVAWSVWRCQLCCWRQILGAGLPHQCASLFSTCMIVLYVGLHMFLSLRVDGNQCLWGEIELSIKSMTYSTSVLLTDATVYSCPLALAHTVVDEHLFLVQGFSFTLVCTALFFRLHTLVRYTWTSLQWTTGYEYMYSFIGE